MRAFWVVLVLGVLILAAVVLNPSVIHRSEDPGESTWALLFEGSPICRMSDAELDELLGDLARHVPLLEDRLRILAEGRLGTPYRRDCLGEGEGVDPDPVFRVDSTDCTVFILTQAAMAHARTVDEARRNMRPANYRRLGAERPVTYAARLHFTMDRLDASPYFGNITDAVAGDVELRRVTLVLNRRADGTTLLPISWDREVTVSYIPAEELNDAVLGRLPAVAGVALVRESQFDLGVIAAHEGMLLDGRDLVHASSDAGRVIKVPFLEYLFPEPGHPIFDGVVFYRFR